VASPEIILASGFAYFQLEDANGVLSGGERKILEAGSIEIQVEPTSLEYWSADGQIAERLANVTTRVARSGKLTTGDMLTTNVAYFLNGTESTVTQVATPVVDEPHTGYKDRWIQLGASPANPTGVRAVSSVAVTGAGGTPTYVLDTDYELDAAMARIRPITAGAITDGLALLTDYTPAANSRTRIATDQLAPRKGALRVIGDNTFGANRDIYIPQVQLVPNGPLVLKSREAFQGLEFQLLIGTRSGYAQVYVDGRPV